MRPSSLWWICIFSFVTESKTLICESYDYKCKSSPHTASENSTCSSLQECDQRPGVTPACYVLFAENKEGGLSVLMKGCIPNNGQECAQSSVCRGQQKRLRKLQPLYYCCCTGDKCNRDVVMFVEEETKEICTMEDIKEAIRNLKLLIWAHLAMITIILILIAIVWMMWKLISYKRQRKTARHENRLSHVVCDKGRHQHHKTSHWKKQDFQLITCLVRSTFGEIWQARLHGSNRVVRIRLSAGSDDVYVYDKHAIVKNTNVNPTRVV